MLGTLRDHEGNTTVAGLDNTGAWAGEPYPAEQFRSDAGVVRGCGAPRGRLGLGHAVGAVVAHDPRDRLPTGRRVGGGHLPGARPASTSASRPARPRRRPRRRCASICSPRPRGRARDDRHRGDGIPFMPRPAALPTGPWRPRCRRRTAGPWPSSAKAARSAVQRVRRDLSRRRAVPHGRGGAAGPHPRPERSVDPSEIANMALVEALFLQRYATAPRSAPTAPALSIVAPGAFAIGRTARPGRSAPGAQGLGAHRPHRPESRRRGPCHTRAAGGAASEVLELLRNLGVALTRTGERRTG